MTGAWLFRLLRESKIYFEFDGRYDERVEVSLQDLAAFIDEYFLHRPLFEDGTPVKVGDIFLPYSLDGEKPVPEEIHAFYVRDDGQFVVNNFPYDSQYKRVMKPEEKIDSWERLEEDAKLGSRHYWARQRINNYGSITLDSQKKDIVRRAKELAKGDSE